MGIVRVIIYQLSSVHCPLPCRIIKEEFRAKGRDTFQESLRGRKNCLVKQIYKKEDETEKSKLSYYRFSLSVLWVIR